MVCGMDEMDIDLLIRHNYWPCVLIDTSPESSKNIFISRVYKRFSRNKRWRIVKTRRFYTPKEAWDYLQETLYETLKFVI